MSTTQLPATGPLEGLEDTSMFRSGFPEFLDMTDEQLVGELRALIAVGDLLAARSLIPQIEHLGLQDATWQALHEDTYWLRLSGWHPCVFGDRVCLAYYDPDGNVNAPDVHSVALGFEHAWRLLHTFGCQNAPNVRRLVKRMSVEQLESVDAIFELEAAPNAATCRRLGIRSGDLVRYDGVLYRLLGITLENGVEFVGRHEDFGKALRTFRARKRDVLSSFEFRER